MRAEARSTTGSTRAGRNKTRFIGQHHRLGPMTQPELVQHAADVRLDRLLGDCEPGCDLRVRQALGEQPEHFGFARRQVANRGVAGSLLAGREILPRSGFTVARGFALLSLTHGPTMRATVGSVLYLALIGLLSLGVTVIVRDPAAAIGTVLGVIYLAPIVALFVGNPVWQRRIERYAPTSAGLTIQDTTGLHHLPIGPWGGIAVLAVWTVAALVAGGLVLRLRNA